jgi:hypothetical protein
MISTSGQVFSSFNFFSFWFFRIRVYRHGWNKVLKHTRDCYLTNLCEYEKIAPNPPTTLQGGDWSKMQIGDLSGGQKSRLAFAVITWKQPHFLILDGLLSAAWLLPSAACFLPSICCLLSAFWCLLSGVCSLSSLLCCLPSAVCRLCTLLSPLYHLLSACYLLSAVCCLLSNIGVRGGYLEATVDDRHCAEI